MGLFNFKKKKRKELNSKIGLNTPTTLTPPIPLTEMKNSLNAAIQKNKTEYHTDLLDLNSSQKKTNSNVIHTSNSFNSKQNTNGTGNFSFNRDFKALPIEKIPDMLPDLEIKNIVQIPEIDSLNQIENEMKLDFIEDNAKKNIINAITQKTRFINIVENQINLDKIESSIKDFNNGMKRTKKLNDLKDSNDSNYMKYKEYLEDIERKLVYLDKLIFNETLY